MIKLILFFTLCCISIQNYSAQNKTNDWSDISSEFLALQNESKNNFIQAHTIMTRLRNLNIHHRSSINYDKVLPVIQSQIEELYKLSNLSEAKIEEYNSSINRPNTFEQDNNILIISNSIVVGEILLTNIFRKAQTLGLYPEGYPANL